MTDANQTAVIRTLYDLAKERQVEVSAISWSGFNLMGDKASIDEVQRLMNCEARLTSLLARIADAGVRV